MSNYSTQAAVSDLQGLTQGFLKSKYGIGKKVQKMLEDTGDTLVAQMQAVVPVDTGRLRNSIRKNVTTGSVTVGPVDVEYASYVEYGTSRMKAQPYIRPSVDKVISQMGDKAAYIGAQMAVGKDV